jgi:hypothetical protein
MYHIMSTETDRVHEASPASGCGPSISMGYHVRGIVQLEGKSCLLMEPAGMLGSPSPSPAVPKDQNHLQMSHSFPAVAGARPPPPSAAYHHPGPQVNSSPPGAPVPLALAARPLFYPDHISGTVQRILRESPVERAGLVAGWRALRLIWGITPSEFDQVALTELRSKPPNTQERTLLAMASIDLSSVHNLSAFLYSLMREYERNTQICIHFLAGVCADSVLNCGYVHPTGTAGWNRLLVQWNKSYKDFDYAVLSYLSKLTPHARDQILMEFSSTNLSTVKNLSAALSQMIRRVELDEMRPTR